jgi:ubiquitin carboxyl-terminal hydrolase 8
VLAERKGEKEEMFLAYTRACAAYANAKMHPDFAGAKRADAHWANRVKDFKEVSGAHRLGVLTVMIRRECIVLIESDI